MRQCPAANRWVPNSPCGGTGSFGNAILRRFLDTDIGEIRIFSRDEKKQDDMRHQYRSKKLRFYIGDVRNLDSVQEAMAGVELVFHAAALKQVPSCEFYPMEAIRTNAIGADNVLQASDERLAPAVIDPAARIGAAKGIDGSRIELCADDRKRCGGRE